MKYKRIPLLATSFLIMGLSLTAQTVTTHPFIARGATTAFARTNIAGFEPSTIKERGICWSNEHKQPTIKDPHTTQTISQGKTSEGGVMHRINNLNPATIYHMRGYVLLQDSTIYYGDAVKVITIPQGDIKWTYNNNNGSTEVESRIKAAIIDAVNYLNEYTSITGFHTTVNYSPGTPTADCSYGGWIRMGANPSFQRTGTILHELQHGIGVGQHWVWCNNAHLRANTSRGIWLGDRVTELLQFWDNDENSALQGDRMHMWPYGINGAHEDTGSELLYIGSSLIIQALGEDGLPPTGGFCTPAYCFNQEDDIKYYIKNEDSSGKGHSTYLKIQKNNQLVMSEMSTKKALKDDRCAWYITFNPHTRYYQFKNAATGDYLTFSNEEDYGFKSTNQANGSSNKDFHLMRSRIDANIEGSQETGIRGYWIIHPEANMKPACMNIGEDGQINAIPFNMSNESTTQRWLILTTDELK